MLGVCFGKIRQIQNLAIPQIENTERNGCNLPTPRRYS
jgi:hypothetical protein